MCALHRQGQVDDDAAKEEAEVSFSIPQDGVSQGGDAYRGS
eukprot:gene17811-5668_t